MSGVTGGSEREEPPAESLYECPDLYEQAFGEAGEDEVDFYEELLGCATKGRGRVLSLGCGPGRLEAALSRRGLRFTGFDRSVVMVRRAAQRDPAGWYVAGCMEEPPIRGGSFAAAVSGLLSFAYVTEPESIRRCLRWLGESVAAGGPVLLEVPLAYDPGRLQGVQEASLFGEARYRFQYLDIADHFPTHTVLWSRIDVESGPRRASRTSRLSVFTPDGIREFVAEAGAFTRAMFYAPYDPCSGTEHPPKDCLRGVVSFRRR